MVEPKYSFIFYHPIFPENKEVKLVDVDNLEEAKEGDVLLAKVYIGKNQYGTKCEIRVYNYY